ncbi:hypothetical protein KIH77_04810 [Bifidobacterium sp. 82T24]|uniref:zinc ribbon domain-containing protein n=1 Tax=Bifidobacterium pluvialisilvae TaxID=2834436 RepID=UPI001C577680|nr:zinc ribbon domain-containing protein [Bifidobacterium pluvialisilvae]MBW3088055.1 hypothetical protein [Bifidobacterium pluvialisilvae]
MKICDQCGQQNPTGARFCRGCGHRFPDNVPVDAAQQPTAQQPAAPSPSVPLPGPVPTPASQAGQPAQPHFQVPPQAAPAPQPQPQPQQQPVPASAQPGSSGAFFTWLWESFKHPSRRYATQTWWAIIPLVCNAFLMALTVYMWQSKAVSAAANVGNGLLSSLTGGSSYTPQIASPGVSLAELFKSWILFAALLYLVVLICFMGRRMFGERIPFAALHTEIAQKTMPMMALNLVTFLFALIGSGLVFLSAALFMLGVSFLMTMPAAIIAQGVNARKIDKTWMWIFAMLLSGLILGIFFAIFAVAGVVGAVSSAL